MILNCKLNYVRANALSILVRLKGFLSYLRIVIMYVF